METFYHAHIMRSMSLIQNESSNFNLYICNSREKMSGNFDNIRVIDKPGNKLQILPIY